MKMANEADIRKEIINWDVYLKRSCAGDRREYQPPDEKGIISSERDGLQDCCEDIVHWPRTTGPRARVPSIERSLHLRI